MTRHASALVIVDLQNDFVARGGYYDEIARLTSTRGGSLSREDIDSLARLHRNPPSTCVIRDIYRDMVARIAEVAATALAREVPTMFIRTAYDPTSAYRPPLFIAAPDRKDYACHPGSWGAEFIDPIKRWASDKTATVVEKCTYDAFFETELRTVLRSNHVDTVYLAGVETNVCVLFTALSALSNGFRTVILEDCVATSRRELHEPTLRIIEVAKGQRISRSDLRF